VRSGNSSKCVWTLNHLRADKPRGIPHDSAGTGCKMMLARSKEYQRSTRGGNARTLHKHFDRGTRSGKAAASLAEHSVSRAALARGIHHEEFLDKVTNAIAHDWFGERCIPRFFCALGSAKGFTNTRPSSSRGRARGETGQCQRIWNIVAVC